MRSFFPSLQNQHDSYRLQVGTDVRKLAYDGYPASHVLGCDLRQEYIDLGRKLFQDVGKCPIHFFTSNIFDLPISLAKTLPTDGWPNRATELAQLRRAVTHLYAGALFHLFDEPTQYAIALRLAVLSTRERGSIIFGRHQGLEEEGNIDDHLGR